MVLQEQPFCQALMLARPPLCNLGARWVHLNRERPATCILKWRRMSITCHELQVCLIKLAERVRCFDSQGLEGCGPFLDFMPEGTLCSCSGSSNLCTSRQSSKAASRGRYSIARHIYQRVRFTQKSLLGATVVCTAGTIDMQEKLHGQGSFLASAA